MRNKATQTNQNRLIAQIQENPKFKGKDVLIIGDEVRILSTRNKAARIRMLTSLVKKYPHETPLITFIPKADTLILITS